MFCRCDNMKPKSVAPCLSKTILLLEKLLHGKRHHKSNKNLDRFVTLLSKQEATELQSTLILLPTLTEWIKAAVAEWSAAEAIPDALTVTFIMNLGSVLARNEERFRVLNTNDFFVKLVKISKIRSEATIPSVKLSYIRLLSTFLRHKSGVEAVIDSNCWKDVCRLSFSESADDVRKESTQFLATLLEKTVALDEKFCNKVIKRIMMPLINTNRYLTTETTHNLDEASLKSVENTLKLIGDILDYFFEGILLQKKDFQVVLLFFENFHVKETVTTSELRNSIFDFGKILFLMEFLDLYVAAATRSVIPLEIKTSIDRIRSNFILSTSKGKYEDALDFCNFSHMYWRLIEETIPKIPTETNKKTSPIQDQLLSLLLFPNTMLLLNHFFTVDRIKELVREEFRSGFYEKVAEMLSPEIYRSCVYWREHIFAQNPNLYELSNKVIEQIKISKKFFSRNAAVITFQSLIYSSKDFIHAAKESHQKRQAISSDLEYFGKVLGVLGLLIEEFQLTWKDSFEIMDVMIIAFDFLSLPRCSTDVGVGALNLINTSFEKYMSPNMTLLVDSTEDTIIGLMGPLLYAKIHSGDGKVMEAALGVICTMALMSRDQFPSLQKVLMDSELPTLVVKMSTCDGESFVRATAIKCLQEMIQVEEIWNNALKTEDLSQKMRDILLNETEGIVRVEAATFMCVAYEHHQFPRDALDAVYETMIYSSTTDLHWEVKVRALAFWDQVIKNHLQNQGMIDGTFPNVTFSKEHRKIVTLTDSEIRKRLFKVLKQLSAIGCLGVLTCAIKDDCDMEVSKTAVKIAQVLVDLFKKYNVRSDSSAPTSPTPTENGHSGMSMSSGISVDESMDSPASGHPADLNEEIIEQIVNAKDAQLLKNVYAPSDYGSVSNYDIQVRKIVSPNEFLQFTQQDLNGIINEKKKWLNGIEDLGSLLDDMLKTYDDDVNNMDCY